MRLFAGPATVMAPGPPEIGKGLFTERVHRDAADRAVRGGPEHELAGDGTCPGRGENTPATLAGTVAQAAGLLVPLAEAIAERNRESWHFHADETTYGRVFCPGEGRAQAKWCFGSSLARTRCACVMGPDAGGAILARHAGLDEKTGQLLPAADGSPRRLVIGSDFYAVYQSAGRKAEGLVNLYCAAHIRRHMVRAGTRADPSSKYWTQSWLALFRDLYKAHDELMAAWQEAASARRRAGRRAAPGERVRGLGRRDRRDRPSRRAECRPRACGNLRRRLSRPWTASGTGSSPTAATR